MVGLKADIEAGVPLVQVDPDRFIQVLVNLLSNALKVAPPRSEVTLAVRRAADGFVAFSVTDRGRGIEPEKIGLLFQKFQQLDGANTRKARGTGLGLAIVKALVEMQGGQVSVESTVGQGSTFTVTVPGGTPVGASRRLKLPSPSYPVRRFAATSRCGASSRQARTASPCSRRCR